MAAGVSAAEQRHEEAIGFLDHLLADTPSGAAGWSIPVDPLFVAFASTPAFGRFLRHLAQRAA